MGSALFTQKRNPSHLSSPWRRWSAADASQICSASKTMRQLSDPVCLRLKPRETEISCCCCCSSTSGSKAPRPGSTVTGEVSAFDVFNGRVCADVFGGSSHQSERGDKEGRRYRGGKNQNVEKCLKSQIHGRPQLSEASSSSALFISRPVYSRSASIFLCFTRIWYKVYSIRWTHRDRDLRTAGDRDAHGHMQEKVLN